MTGVHSVGAIVADIAHTIPVNILLIGVGGSGTVVHIVADPIAVRVRAVDVAGIAHTIAISV